MFALKFKPLETDGKELSELTSAVWLVKLEKIEVVVIRNNSMFQDDR